MCVLKSRMVNHAPLKCNFYICFAKKKIDLKEKEKGHLLHQYGLVILSPVCKPEVQSKLFSCETRSFCCVWI